MKSTLLLASALTLSACAFLQPVPTPPPVPQPLPPAPIAAVVMAPDASVELPAADAGDLSFAEAATLETADAGAAATDADDEAASTTVQDEGPAPDDGEPKELAVAATDGGYRYTADLSDAELARRWKEDPASLGSISVGFVEEGRLINGMPFPEGEAWSVIVPESCWTTKETADAIIGAARQVREWFPNGAPVRVGQVSGKEGGYLPPHISHQNGRDIDVGLFYPGPEPYRIKEREKVMDVPMNWAFAKAMVMNGDVQFILLDKRVQKVLYDYALAHGEDKKWLDSLFHAGPRSMFFHARKHRDHFHVRLYNPRAQELAHRLAPLMKTRAEQNIAFHRVVKGDTLGRIAHKMGSSVKTIQNANHLTNTRLKVGVVLKVPLKGPCTNCPVPPLMVVPPRHLPPTPPATPTTTAATAKPAQG